MMMRAGLVAFFACAAVTPATAEVSNLGQSAVVSLDGHVSGSLIDQTEYATSVAGPIEATTSFDRTFNDGIGNSVAVTGSSKVTASLSSSAIGSVIVDQSLSVVQDLQTSTPADLSGMIRGFGSYSYGFVNTSTARFLFTYDVSSFGLASGGTPAQLAFLKEESTGNQAFYSGALSDGAKGSFTAIIGPGVYDFNIQDFYSNTAGGPYASNSGLSGMYSFSVAGVPEPASWVMMIGGFALIGAVMRRSNILARPT